MTGDRRQCRLNIFVPLSSLLIAQHGNGSRVCTLAEIYSIAASIVRTTASRTVPSAAKAEQRRNPFNQWRPASALVFAAAVGAYRESSNCFPLRLIFERTETPSPPQRLHGMEHNSVCCLIGLSPFPLSKTVVSFSRGLSIGTRYRGTLANASQRASPCPLCLRLYLTDARPGVHLHEHGDRLHHPESSQLPPP